VELSAVPDAAPIVVFGASGNVGSALTRRLVRPGSIVRAFFDPSSGPAPQLPAGAEQIHASFDDATAVRCAVRDAGAAFLLTPPHASQVAWQRTMIQSAADAGVARLVKLSAFDSAPDSPLHMGRWHHDGEVALAESGCDWAVLRPQYFMQNLVPAMREAATTGVWRGAADPRLRLGVVDVEDIAAVAAVQLSHGGHSGEVLFPTGPESLSFVDMAAVLEHAIGRPVRYEQRAAAEVVATFSARGWPRWHIDDYLKIHGEAASPAVTSCVLDVTGTAPTTFAAFISRLAFA
jgi:uncharacterized protein YbjT (DUF2867 family)